MTRDLVKTKEGPAVNYDSPRHLDLVTDSLTSSRGQTANSDNFFFFSSFPPLSYFLRDGTTVFIFVLDGILTFLVVSNNRSPPTARRIIIFVYPGLPITSVSCRRFCVSIRGLVSWRINNSRNHFKVRSEAVFEKLNRTIRRRQRFRNSSNRNGLNRKSKFQLYPLRRIASNLQLTKECLILGRTNDTWASTKTK